MQTSESLLNELIELTEEHIKIVEELKLNTIEILNYRKVTSSWTILECIEHLNRYGDFYIPEIQSRIKKSEYKFRETSYKSNWFGNYFTKSVSYKEKLNKMKTFKSMNPILSDLNIHVLQKFIDQQYQIIDLLKESKQISLSKTKTAISISPLIKLKLGDTFRVLIYHNQRHLIQAKETLLSN